MDSNCKSCKYFLVGNQLGQCRRYPSYQNRHENEWCGEFETDSPAFDHLAMSLASMSQPELKKRGRPAKHD